MRKETDLARVKMIAHVLLDMPIAETSFSPAIAFFAKLAMAYFDYRKHGQFEWAGPVILFVCLVFVLLAPNYIWGIIGI